MTDIDEVALVHVADDKMYQEDIDFRPREAASMLQQYAKDLEEAGLKVIVHVLKWGSSPGDDSGRRGASGLHDNDEFTRREMVRAYRDGKSCF